jgi:chaperone required for assembly of F1-ATPase
VAEVGASIRNPALNVFSCPVQNTAWLLRTSFDGKALYIRGHFLFALHLCNNVRPMGARVRPGELK